MYCHAILTPTFFLSQVPDLMRKSSSKRILNQRPLNLPTKTLRTKSLLWVKPTVTVDQLSASVVAQVQNLKSTSQTFDTNSKLMVPFDFISCSCSPP